jgi:CHAT domain-containing protein/tetratricopeptide (TPR) repeat protein
MSLIPALSLSLLLLPGASQPAHGVVVEEVQAGYAAHRAGLLAGDLLLAWERVPSAQADPQPARGDLDSPFDLLWVEREHAPRGRVTLRGTREGVPVALELPAGDWNLRARPALSERELASYAEGRQLAAQGELERGVSTWRELSAALRSQGRAAAARWLLAEAALAAGKAREWELTDRLLAEAAGDARAAADWRTLALLHAAAGDVARGAGEWDRASAAFGESLAAYRALGEPTLGEAWVLARIGNLESSRGKYPAAAEPSRRALAIRQELAPDSTAVASSHLYLGDLAWRTGDRAAAETHFRRALSLYEALRDDAGAARALDQLGVVATYRGDLALAEEHLQRAVALDAPLRSATRGYAITSTRLAAVAFTRGKLKLAEELDRRALAVFQELRDDVAAAITHHNLSGTLFARGELEAAAAESARGIEIFERLAPESEDFGSFLTRRGMIAMQRGDREAAEADLRRGLEVKQKAQPDSTSVRFTLNQLATLELGRGDLARARQYLSRALAIEERQGVHVEDPGLSHRLLGDVAAAAGELDAADGHYGRSLDSERRIARGTAAEAEICERLAGLQRRRDQLAQALESYRCALDALETQRRALGGSDEVRASFGARYARFYYDTADLLVEMGRPEEAFHVSERYRARGLLALLAERDLVLDGDLPAELAGERRDAARAYDSTLAALVGAEGPEAERLRAELDAIRRRQVAVREAIRAASPRLAALQYPQPLDLAGTRGTLDPGTLLLSYLLGEEGGYLFVVGPGSEDFAALPLAVGREALRADVTRLRELLQVPGGHNRGRLDALARRLGESLLLPAAKAIGRADRLLIVPDGPLHLLPFAALVAPAAPPAGGYLGALRPLHVAASATVFAELKQERGAWERGRLLAFADPDYAAMSSGAHAEAAPAALRSARAVGLELRPLPGARREASAIAAAYHGSAQVYVGGEATEERFKEVAGEAALIHLACHGIADESSPLDSGLALAMPARWEVGRENGLLQAWEVFEHVRIDAELVTLSACSSALGKEMSGEGVLGLTRAFQFAGARTVLASLWQVSDASTARLMEVFYRRLAAGESKDVALQRAQRELMEDQATAHPHHWAAFLLSGDWR